MMTRPVFFEELRRLSNELHEVRRVNSLLKKTGSNEMDVDFSRLPYELQMTLLRQARTTLSRVVGDLEGGIYQLTNMREHTTPDLKDKA